MKHEIGFLKEFLEEKYPKALNQKELILDKDVFPRYVLKDKILSVHTLDKHVRVLRNVGVLRKEKDKHIFNIKAFKEALKIIEEVKQNE